MSMRIRRETPSATAGTCRKCRQTIYRCADLSCDRGGWYSVDGVARPGEGRHECEDPGSLEKTPHVPE